MKKIYKKKEEKLTSEGTELRQPVAELEAPTTYCKQTEEALQESEELFQTIVSKAPVVIWSLDKNGIFTLSNGAGLKPLGLRPGEVVGQSVFDVYRDVPQICEDNRRALAGETLTSIVEVGDLVYESHYSPLQDKNGEVIGMVGVSTDITERKRMEEALKESRDYLKRLTDSMWDAVFSVKMPERVIEWANDSFRLIGYEPAECIGKTTEFLYPDKDGFLEFGNKLKKAMSAGKDIMHTEQLLKRKNGEVFPAEITATIIRNEEGEVVGITSIVRDITERKKAEERLQTILKTAIDGFWLTNLEGKLLEVNDSYCKMIGYTREELLKMSISDLEAAENPEEVAQHIAKITEKGYHSFESRHRRKDGKIINVEISVNYLDVGEGQFFVFARDITDRKQAEEALQAEKNKLQSVIGAMEYDLTIQDKDFNVIYQNESSRMSSGGDHLGEKCYRVYEGRDKICDRCPLEKAFKDGKSHTAERRRVSPSGEVTFWENTANPIRDAKGEIVSCLEIGRNITERKHMEHQLQEKNEQLDAQNEELRTINEELQATEEELQHSQERLERMFESVTDGIVVATLDGTILKVNQRAVQIHGFASEDKMLGRSAFDLVAPRDHERIGADIRKALKEGLIRGGEYTLLRVDGTEFPGELSTSALKDGRGNVIGHISISRDITGRKQAEAALRESEEKFSKVFSASAHAICITSLKDNKIIEVNDSFTRFTGYTRQEVVGSSTAELGLWMDKEELQQWQNKLKKNGRAYNEEIHSRMKSGEIRVGLASAETINIGDEPCRIAVIADITERKQMEKLFKTVTNSSQVGIYIVQGRKFQMANPQFQKLTGFTEDELTGMDSLALVLDEDRDKVREEAIKMLNGERSSPYQFRVLNKAGETRWVMETVTSIPYRGGRAILGNYMDITERRQAEEREKQLEQELNLAGRLASIGQLAAGVAHEINNPLTGVIGFSHLMLNRDIPDDMKQDLQVIHSEAQRVAKIVENLLVFAHQRKPGREYLNINEIINRVLELRAYEMKVNNIDVENRLAPDLPSTMADAGQLQQVFLNIVLNAEHFMSRAHNKGKLVVKTEKIGGNIRASFTDNGAGISKENLDKIFNPFFTTKDVGDGTGLGLSICHGIITQHNGRIYAESELGKGATFVIELPIVADPTQPGKADETKKEPRKPRGAKILVVDDEVAILVFLKRLLTEWGHSVETINNANKALERLKTERYSLILLDIKLPGMSGIELYQHIEETVPALTRRVIFITGDIMQGATRSFLEKTGVPHITKPIDIEVLKKMINRALNQTKAAPVASG